MMIGDDTFDIKYYLLQVFYFIYFLQINHNHKMCFVNCLCGSINSYLLLPNHLSTPTSHQLTLHQLLSHFQLLINTNLLFFQIFIKASLCLFLLSQLFSPMLQYLPIYQPLSTVVYLHLPFILTFSYLYLLRLFIQATLHHILLLPFSPIFHLCRNPTPSLSPPQSTTTSSSILPPCSCNSSVLFTGSTSQSVSSNNQPVLSNSLKIFYFKARSLFPKLYDLSSLCSIHSPDLVCIVESWLSSDITNLDTALNNYYLFCRDRNRHGGSIVIYIRSHLIASEIPLPSEIELLLLSVKFKLCSLTVLVGTFYQPPSSPHDLDNLLDVLSSFNPSIFLNFIISIPYLTQDGSPVTSPSDKANVLNQYFFSCFNNLTTPLSPSTHPPDNTFSPDYLCNPEDICNLISCIPIDTTPGPDSISSIMLHNTASSISLPLSLIFNSSISSGTFPTDWKNSFVVPILKSKSPSSSPSDCCPISLLSLVSKIHERHIFNYLYDFCSNHNLLSNNQFGFRPSFSTETALQSNVNSLVFLSGFQQSCLCCLL